MKKISILAALMAVLTLSFTSCKEDTQPRLGYPEEGSFQLNTPAYANQLYMVEEGGSIEFTCSQANYGGLATTPTYQLEVSSTPDFSPVYKEVKGEKVQISPAMVDFTTNNARMTVPAEPFCIAMCQVYDYQSEEECVNNPRPLYVRCISFVQNASDAYTIKSNIITLKQVQPYFAVILPDNIYLVGQPQGWAASPVAEWALPETEIGNRIYKNTFFIPAGEFQFRFYDDFDASSPWDWFSIGSQDDDNPKDISFTDGEYTGSCFYDPATEKAGKGSWQVTDFPGGNVEMTVNLNTKTVVFKIVD